MLLIGIIPIFGMIGVITICCCKVAGEADRIMHEIKRERDINVYKEKTAGFQSGCGNKADGAASVQKSSV